MNIHNSEYPYSRQFLPIKKVLDKLPYLLPYHCIIPYIEPRFENCTFNSDIPYITSCKGFYDESNYSTKYQAAIDTDEIVIRKTVWINGLTRELSLSRILKKNEKHRYYLTLESHQREYIGCGCGYYDCRDSSCMQLMFDTKFTSKYVGKNFHDAVMKWIQFPKEFNTIREQLCDKDDENEW